MQVHAPKHAGAFGAGRGRRKLRAGGEDEGTKPPTPTEVVLDEGGRKALLEQLAPDGPYARVREELEAMPPGLDQSGTLRHLQQRLGNEGLSNFFGAVQKALDHLRRIEEESLLHEQQTPPEHSREQSADQELSSFEIKRPDRIWASRRPRGQAARRRAPRPQRQRGQSGGPIDSSSLRTRDQDEKEANEREAALYGGRSIDDAASSQRDTPGGAAQLRELREVYNFLLQSLGTNRAREYVVCCKLPPQHPSHAQQPRGDVLAALSDWLPIADALVAEEPEFSGNRPVASAPDALRQGLPEHLAALHEAAARALSCDADELAQVELEFAIESQDSFATVYESAREETVMSGGSGMLWALEALGLSTDSSPSLEDVRQAYERGLQEMRRMSWSNSSVAEEAKRLRAAHDELMSSSSVKPERVGAVNATFATLGDKDRNFAELGVLKQLDAEGDSGDDEIATSEVQEAEVGIALRPLSSDVTSTFYTLNQRRHASRVKEEARKSVTA